MASLKACPNCGRRAKKAISSNWFPVYTCSKCKTKYCKDCGGSSCPKCRASSRGEFDKVYS